MQDTHPYPDSVVTPDQWCSCGQYRAAEADGRYGVLCPVCVDKVRGEQAGTVAHGIKGIEATVVLIDETRTVWQQAIADSSISAADAAAAFATAFQVLDEEIREDGTRVINDIRILSYGPESISYCVMNEELVCAQPAPFIDNVRQCCTTCPYSIALTVAECNECAEGIAHDHSGHWLPCIERCPGCTLCPIRASDD